MQKKEILINDASIIDLKAELARKEETSRKRYSDDIVSKGGKKTLEKLASLTSRRKLPRSRNIKTNEPSVEENERIEFEKQLEESKQKLQAKSKLYDKIQQGEIYDDEDDETGETRYLVDFSKKSITDEQWRDVTDKDEWVEFTDSFGRQRKCQRKDLNEFKALDPDLIVQDNSFKAKFAEMEAAHLEEMHKKWDKEEAELKSDPTADVHYESVKFDEVRQLGVGYYKFSKNEESRKEEMDLLNNLREQTLDQRNRHAQLEKKRKDMMAARIEKIKQRKAAKLDKVSASTTAVQDTNNSSNVDAIPDQANQPVANVIPPECNSESQIINAITQAKPNLHQMYVEKQRDERLSDFAPPQIYNTDSKIVVTNTRHITQSNQDTETLTIDEKNQSMSDQIDDFLSQCRS